MSLLYTHTDFDGLACAVLITSVEEVQEVRFVEPEDVQQKRVEVSKGAIISDLPFHGNAGKWFDHHSSAKPPQEFEGRFDASAKSAARVVMEYYDNPFLRERFSELVDAADKIDSADFTEQDVRKPQGYFLLSFSLEGDESASEARAFRRRLVELLKKKPLAQALAEPEVRLRVENALAAREKAAEEAEKYSREEGRVCVTDLRNAPQWLVHAGTRFLVYLRHPGCTASVRLRKSKRAGEVEFSLGENIFSRACKADLGEIARKRGGGGHKSAAGFSCPANAADAALDEIVKELNAVN